MVCKTVTCYFISNTSFYREVWRRFQIWNHYWSIPLTPILTLKTIWMVIVQMCSEYQTCVAPCVLISWCVSCISLSCCMCTNAVRCWEYTERRGAPQLRTAIAGLKLVTSTNSQSAAQPRQCPGIQTYHSDCLSRFFFNSVLSRYVQ